jgi:hypothetical protein
MPTTPSTVQVTVKPQVDLAAWTDAMDAVRRQFVALGEAARQVGRQLLGLDLTPEQRETRRRLSAQEVAVRRVLRDGLRGAQTEARGVRSDLRYLPLESRAYVRGAMGQPMGTWEGHHADPEAMASILVAYTEGADAWRARHRPEMPPQAPIAYAYAESLRADGWPFR